MFLKALSEPRGHLSYFISNYLYQALGWNLHLSGFLRKTRTWRKPSCTWDLWHPMCCDEVLIGPHHAVYNHAITIYSFPRCAIWWGLHKASAMILTDAELSRVREPRSVRVPILIMNNH